VSAPEKPIAPIVTPAPIDSKSRQKARSLAIAGGLIFLVILFYLLTIFKMGAGVVNRPM
jgi:hypothetical protein